MGVLVYSTEQIRPLMQTDFPDPVVPATRRCGVLATSMTIESPVMVFPRTIGILKNLALRAGIITSKPMVSRFLFGTSTPMAGFPGIGARIRTSSTESSMAMFSEYDVTDETLMPLASVSSYSVNVGPCWTPTRFVSILNCLNVSTMVLPSGSFSGSS